MKRGDLVRFEGLTPRHGTVGLVVKVMWANDICWFQLLGQQDFISEIGWKVISESEQ